MKKIFLLFILIFYIQVLYSQDIIDPNCVVPIGTAYEDNCEFYPLSPSVSVGTNVNRCFTFHQHNDYDFLSYIYVVSTCGPFQPYNQLTFTIYNSTCDTLIQSGSIYPNPFNNLLTLDTNQTFIICYQWKALCNQSQVCAVIVSFSLSVDWLYFQGILNKDIITLNWVTSSEINCDYYEIQESKNFVFWESVCKIKGKGNSTQLNYYTSNIDSKKGFKYFRIKQVDYDFKYSYSKIIFINNDEFNIKCDYYNIIGIFEGNNFDLLSPGIYIEKCENDIAGKIIVK